MRWPWTNGVGNLLSRDFCQLYFDASKIIYTPKDMFIEVVSFNIFEKKERSLAKETIRNSKCYLKFVSPHQIHLSFPTHNCYPLLALQLSATTAFWFWTHTDSS